MTKQMTIYYLPANAVIKIDNYQVPPLEVQVDLSRAIKPTTIPSRPPIQIVKTENDRYWLVSDPINLMEARGEEVITVSIWPVSSDELAAIRVATLARKEAK